MSATYKGKAVTVLRPATKEELEIQEDTGYVLVRMLDGTERIVAKDKLGESPDEEAAPSPPAPSIAVKDPFGIKSVLAKNKPKAKPKQAVKKKKKK